MAHPVNVRIVASAALCNAALARGLSDFGQLTAHVQSLEYGRTSKPEDPLAVLQEGRGTCSSKHRLLAAVAHE